MSLFADQAAIAITNTRLHHQAEQLAVLEERQRLARELHDSVSQSLYSLTLYTDAARLALSKNETEAAGENLQELRNMAREAMLDMRLLIFELHPPILENEGLVIALRTRLESVEARSGIHTEFDVEEEVRLPIETEAELYRIAQEALNNAVKHSQAKNIRVHLQFKASKFRMNIWDNGIGFDPKIKKQSGGLGLRGMEDRVKRINGRLTIVSNPGSGTQLTVEVDI
jgi:signal transduction histidine kinase